MEKSLIIPKQIVTVNDKNEILKESAIEIIGNKINAIYDLKEFDVRNYDGRVYKFPDYTLIPGFIQTHIHLCQTLFRGLADDLELLDWLQKKIFPFENAHNAESLRLSAQFGINELQSNGTTTILDMGTLRHQEVIFEELQNSGMRAFAGKCMIDQNIIFPHLCESTRESLKTTSELADNFHNSAEGRVKYGFAPRFALSCSEALLKQTCDMMKNYEGSLFHTHSSENKSEVEEVRKLYKKENIEYFDSLGVLNDHTVLAHCIHTGHKEVSILKKKQVRVAHCPSSNLKLGSGIANIPLYLKEGINVSLGADGAPCNNNLNIFNEMRLAALIQKPLHGSTALDSLTAFRLATIEGAKALHLEKATGSIEKNKLADLVLLELSLPHNPLSNEEEGVYSSIVYTCDKSNVRHVMIDGQWVVFNGISQIYESNKLVSDAKKALSDLFKRIEVN